MARYSGHSTMGWMMGADGNPIQVVTAAPTTSLQRLAPQPQQMVLPATPDWRTNQVAPGMWGPRAGLELLPMQATIPQFDALNTGPITFTNEQRVLGATSRYLTDPPAATPGAFTRHPRTDHQEPHDSAVCGPVRTRCPSRSKIQAG